MIDSTDNLYLQTNVTGVVKDELASKYFYLQLEETSDKEKEIVKLLNELAI